IAKWPTKSATCSERREGENLNWQRGVEKNAAAKGYRVGNGEQCHPRHNQNQDSVGFEGNEVVAAYAEQSKHDGDDAAGSKIIVAFKSTLRIGDHGRRQ